MQDYVLKLLVELLMKYLTKSNLEKWADQLKNIILPRLRIGKNELIVRLRAEAAKTPGAIDDNLVNALDVFLDALLPDSPSHL